MDIRDAIRKHEDRLMSLPNVRGVAPYEEGGVAVIKVYVTHKAPISSLRPHEVIPKTVEGYATVVEVLGEPSAAQEAGDIIADEG